jgi:hypothetical protein
LSEAEHETHGKMRRGDATKILGARLAIETGNADQRFGRAFVAHFADLRAAPQHGTAPRP